MVQQLLDEIDGLTTMASRYKVVGRSRKRGSAVHSMVVRPYIVYYRVDESRKYVFVLTIRHGARRQPRRFK
jgi:plasmid stabilization system protein ParE